MPWNQTDTMTERVKLITEYLSGEYSVSELSRRYGVSRPIVYKWVERYVQESWEGLEERSRAPHRQARALSPELEEQILAFKQRWPDWGAPKLRQKLLERVGPERCPGEGGRWPRVPRPIGCGAWTSKDGGAPAMENGASR